MPDPKMTGHNMTELPEVQKRLGARLEAVRKYFAEEDETKPVIPESVSRATHAARAGFARALAKAAERIAPKE